jgi:hypothetical protein
MKQSSAQCNRERHLRLSSNLPDRGTKRLTAGGRLTKFGQIGAAILGIDARISLTANLGSSLIDGAKET